MSYSLADPWCIFDEATNDTGTWYRIECSNELTRPNQEDAVMDKPEIRPIDGVHSFRQGGLYGVTVREVEAVLGFPPNVVDDPDKVTVSWSFDMNGNQCAIWDYKGSLSQNHLSTFGVDEVFDQLFGYKYHKD
jgi:hypothetical protein